MMNADGMTGKTVHIARGAKYAGAFEIAEATEEGGGWVAIRMTNRVEWHTREEDTFATESEARECAKSRRQPRRQRVGLYGDFGWLAVFSGIRTDGTGTSNHKKAK